MRTPPRFQPLALERLPEDEMTRRSAQFLARIAARRTVRDFSPEPVPFSLIENAVRCASLAPSGANRTGRPAPRRGRPVRSG